MSAAENNRAAFPETAKLVDEFRAVFGPDVKLTWAAEGGREIGKPWPDDGVPVTPAVSLESMNIKTRGKR